MFTIDAHLDLSMNAMEWNRDLRKSIQEIRSLEEGMTDKPDRGNGVVNFSELRNGEIGLVIATQIARYANPDNKLPGWNSPEQAWAQTQAQLAWYRMMEECGEMVNIRDKESLEKHILLWKNSTPHSAQPIGYILSLEGADSIITPGHLERAYAYGLRALGPAHYGRGRYAYGTDSSGGLGTAGRELLKEMERLHIILDATHLCDVSFWEAMDHFHGPVWASHNNCRALVNHNRQFSDEQIRELISRGAVIGAVMDAWMMVPDWKRGLSTPAAANCDLNVLIDHIDHICQLAGNALHCGIGSDLDGAFGKEQCPVDIETIADVQKLSRLLGLRGYSPTDIENIMHGNWLRFLRNAWG